MPTPLLVTVATIRDVLPLGLDTLPPHEVITSSASPWGRAANALLDDAAERGADVLFLDDDVTLSDEVWSAVQQYRARVAMMGFTLLVPPRWDHAISAQHTLTDSALLVPRDTGDDRAMFTAHVSTTAVFLRNDLVADRRVRFPEWAGTHCEDVIYCLSAWMHGYNVAYIPAKVQHHWTVGTGVGATKAHDTKLTERLAMNRRLMEQWITDHDVRGALARGIIPVGTRLVNEGV